MPRKNQMPENKQPTQKEKLVALFRMNNNRLRLGDIMRTELAAEYRARMTELRKQGYSIICERGEKPSENMYYLRAPEPNGQLRFV